MPTFLAAIPLKDWIYCGAIAALLGGFALYTHHERSVGANEALAPVAVVAHKAEVKVAVGTAVAQSTEKDNGKNYDAAVARPAEPAVGLVCVDRSSGEVPEAAASSAPGADRSAADTGEGQSFDPSGPVLTNDSKAEAQIVYLQARVIELETQMANSP